MQLKNIHISIKDLKAFDYLPNCKKRNCYENLPESIKSSIIKNAQKYNNSVPKQILATDYLAYTRIGNRVDFESLYFDRRRALASLTLAECVENKNTYLDSILNLIILICEESGWQLPAHNNFIRDTKAKPFPDTEKPILDLFALETSALLSTVIYLLFDKLNEKFNFVIDRTKLELKKRIITPYLNQTFWWTGENNEPTLNWTVWCTQNALITTFLSDFSDEIRLKVLTKSLRSIDRFVEDYDTDGCCDEGAEYYRHAGLCLFGSLDILNNVTNNKFNEVFNSQKIKNIANYIKNVHVDGKYYLNFADCSPIAGYAGAREYLFSQRINDLNLKNFALLQHLNTAEKDLPNEINLFYKVQSVLTSSEMMKEEIPKYITYEDIYYEGVGLLVARDTTYCLGVKTGNNDDNHNHNDTGSFTIYKNGKPFIIDVGVESYSAKTFSENRYEIWTMQSSYHNLPDFDNIMQMNGENYKATNVKTLLNDNISTISMQLENAYPASAKLNEFNRTITLNKNNNIVIEDTIKGTYKNAILNLMLSNKPTVNNNIINVDNIGEIKFSNIENIEIEEIEITDIRLKTAWNNKVYRVRISFKDNLKLVIN